MKEGKDKYEPPRAMRLTSLDGGAGDCNMPGSSDSGLCYVPGNTAGGTCLNGVSATGLCSYDGNTAASCSPGLNMVP